MSDVENLLAARDSVWRAFLEVGGNAEMFRVRLFKTEAQAYYAGQVVGIDRAATLMMLEMPWEGIGEPSGFDGE